jgi:hypothetical protein
MRILDSVVVPLRLLGQAGNVSPEQSRKLWRDVHTKIFIANFRESIVQQKFKGSKVDQLKGLTLSSGHRENDENVCPPSCEDKKLISDWLDLS